MYVWIALSTYSFIRMIDSFTSTSLSYLQYDYFVVDQWGVLHNGKKPYSEVLSALNHIKASGRLLILLSNSSKRKAASFAGLSKVGIDPTLFLDIVTSGEVGHRLLSGPDSVVGRRLFVIGNGDDDREYVQSAGCDVSDLEHATGVLARGTFSIWDNPDSPTRYQKASELIDQIDPWLERFLERKLPILVTNPDHLRPGTGDPMPGIIGDRYQAMGGVVHFIGKPFTEVYDECINIITQHAHTINTNPSSNLKKRICCVGDSLDHDILGAQKYGLDSAWTVNGVHCLEMQVDPATYEGSIVMPDKSKVDKLLTEYNAIPTHILPCFVW